VPSFWSCLVLVFASGCLLVVLWCTLVLCLLSVYVCLLSFWLCWSHFWLALDPASIKVVGGWLRADLPCSLSVCDVFFVLICLLLHACAGVVLIAFCVYVSVCLLVF